MKLNIDKPKVNTVHLSLYKCALLVLCLFFSPLLFAQLTVTAVATPETCTGNGALQLSVQNQTPGTTITYVVYTGTNTTGTIVHNNTSPTVGGQPDGTYYIVATEYVGTVAGNSANTTAAIADQTTPLTFTADKTVVHCGNDASITINVTAGTAAMYRITQTATGTVTQQPASQANGNVFNNLAAGQYTVFVLDTCGDGTSQVVTVLSEYHQLELAGPSFPDVVLAGCDLLTIGGSISSTNSVGIIYPLQAIFTVYPPTGGSVDYPVTVSGGEEFFAQALVQVPYYYNQPNHTFKFTVTDICGNSLTSSIFTIDPLLTVVADMKVISCSGKTLEFKPFKYVGPFTLEFIQSPPGFNPNDYNAQYPGPYTGLDVPVAFGEEGNPLPYGFYQVKIYDACNREVSLPSSVVEIPVPDIIIIANPSPATCTGNGAVEAYIQGLPMSAAEITTYVGSGTYPTPADVSQYIVTDQSAVQVGNLPPGEYTITLTDTCGVVYPPKDFIIKPYNGDAGSANSRPDCEQGYGTVQINATFTHIEMIMAPSSYPFTIPHDVTAYFNPAVGSFTMDHLPPGQYKFKGYNDCDDDVAINAPTNIVPIFAYTETVNDYSFTPHCGSFDIFMNHQSTGAAFLKFGLQKWNETLQAWTHPGTDVLYAEGEELINDPDADVVNALLLVNNANNLDLLYPSGKYRIVKQYTSYADGSLQGTRATKYCTQTLYEFEYYKDIVIDGAVSVACMGNSGDVMILAHGVPPLHYKIVQKNGQPFEVDNGTNNIFSGLDSAVYVVEVSDQCSQRTLTFNIADIPPLVSVPEPSELDTISLCDEGSDGTETFDISGYEALILDDQDPDDVTITFHTSMADAQQGSNAITDTANVVSGSATIYVRASHSASADCIATTHFDLFVRLLPPLTMKETWGACEGGEVTITADPGYAYYGWTNPDGDIFVIDSNQITVSEPGTYSVMVTDNYGCTNSKTFQVVASPLPVITTVQVDDWTDNNNIITVVMENTAEGSYQYSLDNVTFQDSPIFTGLAPGQYTVYVKDIYDCGNATWPTYILTYPKFFTPNGDNINDFWRIKLSSLEPDMLIYIYDRYGQLITGFDPKSIGWDGTLNGTRLPATDYWFVVKRQNGEELKGHFSMIR